MKISVVVTVFNEEASIRALLDSLLSQTLTPTEIVIVDGGSQDQTVDIIKDYKERHKLIRLIKAKGSIAHGRNVSIKHARYEIIAQTDAGCVAKKDWLAKITKPLEDKNVGVVAGFYKMVAHSAFQKAAASYFGTPPERFDPRMFLPSARSVAFRKSVWKDIGGYNEKLERAGEDTLFNYEVIKAKIQIIREKNAIVYWEVPKTFLEAIKKFYDYAKGDAQAGIWWHPAQGLSTHNIKISTIFARYLIGLILFTASLQLPILFFVLVVGYIFYIAWSCQKFNDVVTDPKTQLYIPLLQIASDFAIMAGFSIGILKK